MEASFIDQLSAQSTLAELPAYDRALELSASGQALDDTFRDYPQLPGVVVTESGAVRGAISRGQYLRTVSRYLGHEIYLPRPIQLMFDAIESMEEPLILARATAVQEAVRRALERPRELVYEPVIVSEGRHEPSSIRLIDFQDLLMADSRISALRNQQMNEILSTVQEGFLLVDRDHRVASEYSKSIASIFGHNEIAGRRLPALLTDLLGSERAELGRDYLETLFNPNVIENLVAQINPLLQVAASSDDDAVRHLAFRFQRSVEDGVIRHVLVRVEDSTREVELAAEVEARELEARNKVDMALSLVSADPNQLQVFLRDLDNAVALGEELEKGKLDDNQSLQVRARLPRRLHGLKGEAGMLGLRLFQEELHQLEDRLIHANKSADWHRVRELIGETRSMIQQFQQLGSLAENEGLANGTDAAEAGPEAPLATPSHSLFDSISQLVEELALRLGKPARFHPRIDESDIPERYHGLLREALAQLARNAMVHGLESPELRARLGKPKLGTLQVGLRQHPEHLEIIFQDDGAGLDLDKIRRKAQQLGLGDLAVERPTEVIFHSGFSTARDTTLDAGRGVGLDMVRDRIREAGGFIVPHFEPGVYCAFQILLPV